MLNLQHPPGGSSSIFCSRRLLIQILFRQIIQLPDQDFDALSKLDMGIMKPLVLLLQGLMPLSQFRHSLLKLLRVAFLSLSECSLGYAVLFSPSLKT